MLFNSVTFVVDWPGKFKEKKEIENSPALWQIPSSNKVNYAIDDVIAMKTTETKYLSIGSNLSEEWWPMKRTSYDTKRAV